jgi:mono/diheme cytochrome c family protein
MRALRTLGLVGLLSIIGAVVAAAYFLGGFYSVAASEDDPLLIKTAIVQVRDASVARHATERPPGALDDPAMIQAGAKSFSERGCWECHGAPGVKWAKFSEGLNPDPPDLKDIVDDMLPQELFWAIKNGIRMTGMPSFGKIEVPDAEIWTIVAFVKKLPMVSDEDYKAWTTSAAPAKP